MAENIYRFEFVDATTVQEEVESGVQDVLGSGANEKPNKPKATTSDKKDFSSEFTKKLTEDSLQNFVISPLNTATGGLAGPVVRTIKSVRGGAMIGASLGTLGATLGIMAIQYGIQALQNRIADIENKVRNLNNTDNILIRAGSVSKATYYTGNIFGVKQTTNRS